MRLSAVFHFQGLLLLLIAGCMLFPLGVSLIYGEGDAPAFAISMVVTAILGLSLWLPFRGTVQSISRRESFAIVTIGWILVSAVAALPFLLAGTFTSVVDAYFEAMSGFTTTGASVMTDIEIHPHGILFWRDMTQWLGGMGIIVLFVAVMPILGVGAVQMFEFEAPGPAAERLTPRIRQTAKALWTIYLALSAALVVLLMLWGLSPFEAITHMFGTMPTGGFSPLNRSVGAYDNPAVEYTITVFMAIAGTNFGLIYLLWRGSRSRVPLDRELRLYLAIIGGATAIVLADLAVNLGLPVGEALRFASFQVVSIQTTTGFATADFDQWPSLSRAVLVGLMVIGASAGSTGGGMKVIRLWILVKYAHREMYAMFQPRAVLPLKLAGKPIPDKIISETVGFSILYALLLGVATLFVTAYGYDLITSFTSVVATLSNVGPGLALVGPTANFAFLPDPVKIVLAFCMLAGRLEIWTVFVLLRPSFWAHH